MALSQLAGDRLRLDTTAPPLILRYITETMNVSAGSGRELHVSKFIAVKLLQELRLP